VWELKLGVAFSLQLDESRDVSALAVYTLLVQKRTRGSICAVLTFLPLSYLTCKMLDFQGMRQQNLYIFRLDVAPDKRI